MFFKALKCLRSFIEVNRSSKAFKMVTRVLYMSFDKFLLAVESRDLSQVLEECLLSES